ncbi:MAG: Aspartate aminotransferase [Syntrophorhabdus sp. PtaB.Bin047]|jgi:aspartate/methionine/tyrosine aminotransferase|nr:MAG: Aspartate aminotransferase [Syntrophorhabdus sp. PtaB.Bin047]
MNISRRASEISPFYVMELLEQARLMEAAGHSVIHMEVGEPGFETPGTIRQEAEKALAEGKTFYTHSLGIPELREAISRQYRDRYGLDIAPGRVIITNGSSGAFILLFAALLERGRTLAIADPGYPCYRNIALLTDCTVRSLPVSAETNYEVLPEQLHGSPEPDVLVVANPSNPTGTIYRADTLNAVYKRLSSRGGVLVVDEIYSGLVYDVPFSSSAAISEDVIVVNGFSKAFAMTGWRLGWMVVPRGLVRPIQKLAQNLFIAPPSISQYAALAAFDDADGLARMCGLYRERRDFLMPRLRGLGFDVPVKPDGAFYIYAGIERFGMDSMLFVERALAEAKVAITPGYDFGSFGAASHVRFSYADRLENLVEGCERLERWLNGVRA